MQPSRIRQIREDVKARFQFKTPIDVPKSWSGSGLALRGQWRSDKLVMNAYDEGIDFAKTNQADVTALYRYKELFKFVAQDQLRRTERPRVLSGPCHIGMESYTLASCFAYQSYGQGRKPVSIEGVDICSKRLSAAQTGVYPISVAAGIPFDYAGFYHVQGDDLVVADEVKDTVTFLPPMDLSAPDALKDASYTASICMNLMLYLSDEQNAQLVDNLIAATSHMIVIGYGSSPDRFKMVRDKMHDSGFVQDRRKHGINLGTYDVYLKDGP